MQDLVRMVQKQSRLYQESVRTLAELTDTTGVDLCAGQAAVRDRSMVAIRADKVARARTYRRILQVHTSLSPAAVFALTKPSPAAGNIVHCIVAQYPSTASAVVSKSTILWLGTLRPAIQMSEL